MILRFILLWILAGVLEAGRFVLNAKLGMPGWIPSMMWGIIIALAMQAPPLFAYTFILLFSVARDVSTGQIVGLSAIGYSVVYLLAAATRNSINLYHKGLLVISGVVLQGLSVLVWDMTFSCHHPGIRQIIIAMILSGIVTPFVFWIATHILPHTRDHSKYRIPTSTYFSGQQD